MRFIGLPSLCDIRLDSTRGGHNLTIKNNPLRCRQFVTFARDGQDIPERRFHG